MKIIALFICLILSSLQTLAADFGQYRYSKYIGISNQMQAQRMLALKRQRAYYNNPARNIRYPSLNNPYPNIQRSYGAPISARERYSVNYYRAHY